MKADFDQVIEEYHQAAAEFIKGNPEPYKKLFSEKEDVTLANPFGPAVRGWERVSHTMQNASSHYRKGEIVGFENLVTYVTPELAYIVETERFNVQIDESESITAVVLRTTSILRPENGKWKIVHRHADPITSPKPWESVIQK